jgi:hypothetical protein
MFLQEKSNDPNESLKNDSIALKDNLFEANNNNSKEELNILNELLEFKSN